MWWRLMTGELNCSQFNPENLEIGSNNSFPRTLWGLDRRSYKNKHVVSNFLKLIGNECKYTSCKMYLSFLQSTEIVSPTREVHLSSKLSKDHIISQIYWSVSKWCIFICDKLKLNRVVVVKQTKLQTLLMAKIDSWF